MFIYLTLGLCALLAGLLVYRYDLYDREPWWMLLAAFTAGWGAMWVMGGIEDWTLNLVDSRTPLVFSIVASTHEEIAKLAIVVLIAVAFPRIFNDPMDGIIYGSIAGLGMAVNESIFYLNLDPPDRDLLPPAEIVRLAGHLVMGGISGFAIGMARMRMKRWKQALLACMAASTALHFGWDWIAISARDAGHMHWAQTVGAVLIMLSGMLLYGVLVVVGSDWSRQHFAPHSLRTLWGWPFSLLRPRTLDDE